MLFVMLENLHKLDMMMLFVKSFNTAIWAESHVLKIILEIKKKKYILCYNYRSLDPQCVEMSGVIHNWWNT